MTKNSDVMYTSYSYLSAGDDYERFELVPELGRVPSHEFDLTTEQQRRVAKLLGDNAVISLHDHPIVYPSNPTEILEYNRTGRHHTAYAGLRESALTAVFDNLMDGTAFITSKAGWKWDDVLYDLGMRLSDIAHQDYVRVATRVADIRRAKDDGKIALIVGLEASTPIENELDRLDILYGLGVRQIGIAYSESNSLGSGLKEPRDGGLTTFGHRAVQRMNKLGLAIDISHSSDQTCLDVIEASDQPVFITHAGARAVWPTPRMKPDEVIAACAREGGVIGLEAAPHTTISRTYNEHSIQSVMDHFEYCVELVGIDHVAFGPDTCYGDHVAVHNLFSTNIGVHQDTQILPPHVPVTHVSGMENPTECFPNIVRWLVEHNYSDHEIRAVIGGNILRVLEEVWY